MTMDIAVIAAGQMGASIGARLVRHGARVLTSLNGRSPATVERARLAGMTDANDDEISSAAYVLSIAPPAEAQAIARRYGAALRRAARAAVYIDCNAVSVSTVTTIGGEVAGHGVRFVDGSIIGAPGALSEPGPTLYLAGETPDDVAALGGLGLCVRSTGGPAGAASALKMAYAGMNKGLAALAAAMVLAADRAGASAALREELAASQPQLLVRIAAALPDMYAKAYRWDFEMREVAAFGGSDDATRQIFSGAAQLYARLARDWNGAREEIDAIEAFLEPLHRRD